MLFVYTIIYLISMLLYFKNANIIASCLLVALAIFLYICEFIISKRVISVKGFFALGFIGGFGLSLLKLSNLSNEYSIMMFIVVFATYFSIYLGGYFCNKLKKENVDYNDRSVIDSNSLLSDYQFFKVKNIEKNIINFTSQDIFVIILLMITLVSFVIEAIILKFIPIFTIDTPHAYSTFHVFGLHYITNLYAYIPCISLCNYYMSKNIKTLCIVIISCVYMILMAILMVSRAQLITSAVLFLFAFIILKTREITSFIIGKKYLKLKYLDKQIIKKFVIAFFVFVTFIVLYIVITINRAHSVSYLNGIFDMKNEKMPIFITQPYMYIAHNFENLNYMINNIFRYTFGRRSLYPLFTFSLIKRFFPLVTDSPYYIIKQELSTTTLVYDFYYDFGVAGVIFFCFILGYVGMKLENKLYDLIDKKCNYKNNYIVVLFAQFVYYMIFSFFQTYLSLPDTWVNLSFLLIIALFFRMSKEKS